MTDPDRQLAGRARRGDRLALGRLYERYRRPLLGYLARRCGNRAMGEDAMQETWLKVVGHIGEYRPDPGPFRAWLFRIARNAAIDRVRRESRHVPRTPPGPTVETDGADDLDRLPGEIPDPERPLLRGGLDASLRGLPEAQRDAVLLRHQQGLSYRELSVALGVPENTAKTMVHRGVLNLRARLEGLLDG